MIAFDIDGCMNNIKEDIMEFGKSFFSSYNVSFYEDGYYLREIWAGADDTLYKRFWEKYGYKIYMNPPKEKATTVIKYIKKNNIPACYITSRDTTKSFQGKRLDEITKSWLEKYDLTLPIHFCKDKEAAVKSLNVQVIVEDKPSNILKLQKVTKVIIFNHPYNYGISGMRAKNWDEIFEQLSTLNLLKTSSPNLVFV